MATRLERNQSVKFLDDLRLDFDLVDRYGHYEILKLNVLLRGKRIPLISDVCLGEIEKDDIIPSVNCDHYRQLLFFSKVSKTKTTAHCSQEIQRKLTRQCKLCCIDYPKCTIVVSN